MGSIGRKRKLSLEEFPSEPMLLNDPESIYKTAEDEGLVDEYGKIDIESFIRRNYSDIDLVKQVLPSDISGELKKNGSRWIMYVNTKHPETRQRFTMSHELGHYVYHRHDSDKFEDYLFYRKRGGKDSMEYKADEFASKILMPESYLTKAIEVNGIKELDSLAKMFDVSSQAMEIRLKELGYNINE